MHLWPPSLKPGEGTALAGIWSLSGSLCPNSSRHIPPSKGLWKRHSPEEDVEDVVGGVLSYSKKVREGSFHL